MTLALTDKQVEDLSNAIASVVVCNLPGTGHLRDQIAAWAEDCLAGTKFEGGSPDQLAPDTGTVEVEAQDIRIDDAEDGIMKACRMIRGVIDVRPNVSDFNTATAESRASLRIGDALLKALHEARR